MTIRFLVTVAGTDPQENGVDILQMGLLAHEW
jgi:hypothetical protein